MDVCSNVPPPLPACLDAPARLTFASFPPLRLPPLGVCGARGEEEQPRGRNMVRSIYLSTSAAQPRPRLFAVARGSLPLFLVHAVPFKNLAPLPPAAGICSARKCWLLSRRTLRKAPPRAPASMCPAARPDSAARWPPPRPRGENARLEKLCKNFMAVRRELCRQAKVDPTLSMSVQAPAGGACRAPGCCLRPHAPPCAAAPGP